MFSPAKSDKRQEKTPLLVMLQLCHGFIPANGRGLPEACGRTLPGKAFQQHSVVEVQRTCSLSTVLHPLSTGGTRYDRVP
jgi:hypothetical protein